MVISSYHSDNFKKWKVNLINTGLNTMTGGRVKRIKPHLNNETFLLTYGDGVSNINLDHLISFHKSHGKLVTITAVRPPARFGELEIEDVMYFLLKKNLNCKMVGLMVDFLL